MSSTEVMGAVYDRIVGSGSAVAALAKDPLTGAPAVYDTWATDEIGPYVVMGFEVASAEGRVMASAQVSLDLFDRRPGTQSRADLWALRDHLHHLFDRFQDQQTPGWPRFFVATDEPIDEDQGKMRAWRITLNVRYFRA